MKPAPSDEDIAVLIPGRDKAMTAKNVMRRFTPEFPLEICIS